MDFSKTQKDEDRTSVGKCFPFSLRIKNRMWHNLTHSSEISGYSFHKNEQNQGKRRNQMKSGFVTPVRNYNRESQEELLKDS